MPGISKCLTYGITIITAKQRHSGWTTCLNSPVASMWKKLNLNLENLTPEASLEITAHGPHFTSLRRWNDLRNNLVWLLLQMRITWAQLSRTRSSTDHLKFVFLPSIHPPTHFFVCVHVCTCHSFCIEFRRRLARAGSLLLSCGTQDWIQAIRLGRKCP